MRRRLARWLIVRLGRWAGFKAHMFMDSSVGPDGARTCDAVLVATGPREAQLAAEGMAQSLRRALGPPRAEVRVVDHMNDDAAGPTEQVH